MIAPSMPPLLSLTLLLLVIGLLAAGGAIWVMAYALVHPPRMGDGKALALLKRLSPADVGLAFEDVSFTVRDSRTGEPLRLAAWWMPHPQADGRCAVIVHDYADAKVGAIAWGPTWHAVGCNVLAIDLRAHGQSDGAACTAGDAERHDLADVLDQLRAERPGEARQVVLFGIGLGAAAAVGAAALREGVADAVVLESPFADFRTAARAHFDLLGLPGGFIRSASVRLAAWMAGAEFAKVRPVDLLAHVACPVMVIAPTEDVFVSTDETAEFERAIASRTNARDDYWRVNGARHLEALYLAPDDYRERLRSFVDGATIATPVSVSA
jgi:hypothetical protein